MGTTDADLDRTAVIILAGGLGTRLKSVTGDTPKPLVPILGRPFIEYLLDHLRSMGFEHLFVTASYRFDLMDAAIAQYRARAGSAVVVLEEPVAAGTFGAVLRAGRHIPSRFQNLLIVNGDSLVNTSYVTILSSLSCRDGSVAAALVPDRSRFGSLEVDIEGRLRAISEKTKLGPGVINVGIYAFKRPIIEAFSLYNFSSIERDFLPVVISRANIGVSVLDTTDFIDIGTPESFAEAEHFPLIKKILE